MTTQTNPNRIVAIAVSVMSILLLVVLLLLLLIFLWRSKPPSINGRNDCLHEKSAMGYLDAVTHFNAHKSELPVLNKTEFKARTSKDLIDRKMEGEATIKHSSDDIVNHTVDHVIAELGEDATKSHEDDINITWGMWRDEILTSLKGDLEFIKPYKISQNIIEDPISNGKDGLASQPHDGHFRHNLVEEWDLYPQYEFDAFGTKFRLQLTRNSDLLFNNVKILHLSSNTAKVKSVDHHLNCLYTGAVDGDPESIISVSLCHGMTGHIKTSTGNYLIKPTEQWSNNKSSPIGSLLKHAILRIHNHSTKSTNVNYGQTADNSISNKHNCGVLADEDTNENVNSVQSLSAMLGQSTSYNRQSPSRRRRHLRKIKHYSSPSIHSIDNNLRDRYESLNSHEDTSNFENKGFYHRSNEVDIPYDTHDNLRLRRDLSLREYFIEITIVADAKMVQYHGSGLFSYILILMSTVSRIYKDRSIGNPVSIALVKVITVDETFGTKYSDVDGFSASDMLRKFCQWQTRYNPSEPSTEHHDIALLLTRENLCNKLELCDTLGLAELGGMCLPGSSCAIVQDNGLAAAFTIVHEIGHVLGIPHDDDSKCIKNYNHTVVLNIMSRMLDQYAYPWEWSACSRYYVTKFLESEAGDCLLDKPGVTSISLMHKSLPGEDYSVNKQCELVFGPGSTLCPHKAACKALWCTAPYRDRTNDCHTHHMPWADGTACGLGKWCYKGECVTRRNLQPIHGQWGEWGRYGECSRTCGGGIKSKIRECNNPPPQYGGNYCIGERIKYRSCNTKECPPGSRDFREEQCARYNTSNYFVQNFERDVKWQGKYTRLQPEDRCKLYCKDNNNQYYKVRNRVIDGTPCGPDTFHMCVDGRCMPAGCDHILYSTAELDTCGVCRGDNSSCQRITGFYNSSKYGYQRVTRIPTGSSNIDVRQYGWQGMANDNNYLAIRIGSENGKYIINGNHMVMHRKVIVEPGLTIEYSGPEPIVERLNSSRPIEVDIIVEVLSVGNEKPPQIMYEYTVPKSILYEYRWILSDWTECDRVCQGTKYRKALCKGFKNGEVVSDDYCRNLNKPQEENQHCNQHCTLQWQIISITECSSHCGKGIQKVKYNCIQVVHSHSVPRSVPNHVCSHLEHGPEEQTCTGSCKDVHWKYGNWSSCSVSCGGGVQTRSAVCTTNSDQKVISDENCLSEEKLADRICNQKSCPKWDHADWTPCSVTCGKGWRERPPLCQVDNHVISMSKCAGTPPQLREVCDVGPCEKWFADNWGSCSVTCGEGIQRRTVTCKTVNNLASNRCNESKPAETRICSSSPCPVDTTEVSTTNSLEIPNNESSRRNSGIESNYITSFKYGYEWHIANYGQCSRSCGNGTASRVIKCISSSTKMIQPSQFCDERSRPSTIVPCNSHPCPKWDTGDWNQCSVKCGEGYQARQVLCRSWTGHVMKDSDCSRKLKPRQLRKCQRRSCKSQRFYKWHTSEWSECSKTCGNGLQSRAVLCYRTNNFGIVESKVYNGCPLDTKPPMIQECKLRDCNDIYYWTTGNWRKCNHPCGKTGRQTRKIFCHNSSGKKVSRHNCSKATRPKKKQKCFEQQCSPSSCSDLKKLFGTTIDGEYNLMIGYRNMSIYCYGMNSNVPKDYLTLPASDDENYAEIYNRRLLNPQSCPYNGRRNDSCHCVTDPGAGKTMFRKIRIDTKKLHIIADDYTFSRTWGANRIEFGKAGDCYSLQNCPQGSFSINLSGTFFKLSQEVIWTTQRMRAYHYINRINDQRIFGKCGGYCGFCTPTNLKLVVIYS